MSTPHKLALREREILALLVIGKSSKEIGDVLEISPGNVNLRLRLLTSKLRLSSRLELYAWAIQHWECRQRGHAIQTGLHPQHCVCPACQALFLRVA